MRHGAFRHVLPPFVLLLGAVPPIVVWALLADRPAGGMPVEDLLLVGAAWLLFALPAGVFLWRTVVRPLNRLGRYLHRMVEGIRLSDEEATLLERAPGVVGMIADPLRGLVRQLGRQGALRQEAEARGQTLFDVAPTIGLVCSLQGTVVDANPALCAALELAPGSLQGAALRSLDDLLPTADLLRLGERSRHERCTFRGIDLTFRTRSGRTLQVSVSVQAVRVQGEWAFLMIAEDETELREHRARRAQNADSVELLLEEQVEGKVEEIRRQMALLEHMVDAGGVVMAAFDEQARTVRWNRSAVELTGYGLEDVPTLRTLVDILVVDDAAREAFLAWLRAPSGGAPFSCAVTTRDGSRRLFSWTASDILQEDGGAWGLLIGVERDEVRPAAGRSVQEVVDVEAVDVEEVEDEKATVPVVLPQGAA